MLAPFEATPDALRDSGDLVVPSCRKSSIDMVPRPVRRKKAAVVSWP